MGDRDGSAGRSWDDGPSRCARDEARRGLGLLSLRARVTAAMALGLGCVGTQGANVSPDGATIDRQPPPDREALVDASRSEVIPERDSTVDDEGWVTPGWLAEGIEIAYSTRPAEVCPRLRWGPCRDGREEGCRELQVSPIEQSCGTPIVSELSSWRTFGETPHLTYGVRYAAKDGPTRGHSCTGPLDGEGRTAWRHHNRAPAYANVYVTTLESGGLATLMYQSPVTHGLENGPVHMVFPGETRPRITGRISDLLWGGNNAPVGATELVAAMAVRDSVTVFARSDGFLPHRINEPAGAYDRGALVASGDALFWTAMFGDYPRFRAEVWVLDGRGTLPQRLLDSGDAQLFGFDTDGRYIAWIVAREAMSRGGVLRYRRGELWASPYATDLRALSPRRVFSFGPVDLHGAHALGAGRYAIATDHDEPTYVVDLGSGRWRAIAPRPGWWLHSPAFVSRTEVGLVELPIRVSVEGAAQQAGCRNLIRIALDSLGPEQPPRPDP